MLRTIVVAAMAAAILTALVPRGLPSQHHPVPGIWVHGTRVRVQRDVAPVGAVDTARICRPRIEVGLIDPDAALSSIRRILIKAEFLRAPPLPL